jgi:hypothetical protein
MSTAAPTLIAVLSFIRAALNSAGRFSDRSSRIDAGQEGVRLSPTRRASDHKENSVSFRAARKP